VFGQATRPGNTGEPTGVFGVSNDGFGVRGSSDNATGVLGETQTGNGVLGVSFQTGVAVAGGTTAGIAVQGSSDSGTAVVGTTKTGTAGVFQVVGSPENANAALKGFTAGTGPGVSALSGNGTALIALGARGGLFIGDVEVSGTFTAQDKNFLIDHPLDPSNMSLVHASVESSERTNMYSGNVVLDQDGQSSVLLPEWFEALNEDFRYQLTCIGRPANVYVAAEVSNGRFQIAGGTPGSKVSWQVVGIRADRWAKANPLAVEKEKAPQERGHYLNPEVLGQGPQASVHWARHPELARCLSKSYPDMIRRSEKA
jgi:hypothetical protein